MLKRVPILFRILYVALIGAFIIFSGFQLRGVIQFAETPDWMFLTGSAVCLIGIATILGIEARVDHAVTEMVDGGVIVGPPKRTILDQIDRAARRSAHIVMAIVVASELIVVITGYVMVPWLVHKKPLYRYFDGSLTIGNADALTFAGLVVVGPLASALVGWYLGKFAAYGRMQEQVVACGGRVVMQPDADDQMGGLRPLVRIVRSQALLTLAPVVWLVLWLVLTAANESFRNDLGFWRLPFFMLLGVAVFYSTLGFFAPLRMLESVLTEQQKRSRNMDKDMGERVRTSVANARRHMTPRSSTYLLLLAIFAGSIAIAGLRLPMNGQPGPVSLFFFGPP